MTSVDTPIRAGLVPPVDFAIEQGVAMPTPSGQRIESIDALRGLVLLGILFMNMPLFALPESAVDNPKVYGGIEGLDWWAWFLSSVLWDGKMRALFSMLFGAGAILLTRRAEASGPEGRAQAADIYYRRMLFLIGFGIIDGYLLLWSGDILYAYGLFGLLLFPLRKLSVRTLIITALCLLCLGITSRSVRHIKHQRTFSEVTLIRAELAQKHEISAEQRETLKDWDEQIKKAIPAPDKLEKAIAARRSGFISNLFAIAPLTVKYNSEPIYLDFDILPMMILGLGLAKAGVITGARSSRFYLVLALACLPLGWFIAALRPLAISRAGFDPEFFTPWSMGAGWGYTTARLLVALGYLAVVMLAAQVVLFRAPMRAIAAAGRMPLTNYLGQSVICALIFTGVGLGLFAKLSRFELVLLTVAIWVPQVIFSVLWLKNFAFGPMEWLWRWGAYGRKPVWRIGQGSST